MVVATVDVFDIRHTLPCHTCQHLGSKIWEIFAAAGRRVLGGFGGTLYGGGGLMLFLRGVSA